ncbi:MAG: Gfo/Idh/MocA family oxidoreductase [Saprospiraceae bacterium]|nr:Gfo/Idh/MocA family oxidoreductase [Saprospiraceae bacterium]
MITRRDMLRTIGLAALTGPLAEYTLIAKEYDPYFAFNTQKSSTKLKAIVIGAGNRGNVYAGYAAKYPDELEIVGVAEPIAARRTKFSKTYSISPENQFTTWEHVFQKPKFADIVIVTTPDNLHYGPAMAALEVGYDMLLEKPIAQTWEECSEILKKQKENKAIVAVCHVLRYSPYYRKVKEVIDSGVLGAMVSMQHFEPIHHIHMSHSFVRGNWHKEADTNPIILAKSCHDLDIIRWWVGKPCKYLSSFGSLKWFKASNAPAGSTARCTDGCAAEANCPYSALKIYHRDRTYLHHFDLPEDKSQHGDVIMKYLRESNYGKCVYRCENDVADHQIVSMEFEDEITVSFNMEAFTDYHGRRTRIMGSMGCLEGDEDVLRVADFRTKEVIEWRTKDHVTISSGHAGGDYGLVRDFLLAVDKKDASLLSSTLDASMESHQMGFLAEESRKKRVTVRVG